MPIERIDHFAVLARDAIASAEFFCSILGLEEGPRPPFSVPGVWLYCGQVAVLHIVERDDTTNCRGSLDHIAFWGSELSGFVSRLRARGVDFKLKKVPAGGPAAGNWQLFFESPDGARIEIGFPEVESSPHDWQPSVPAIQTRAVKVLV